MHAGEGGGAGGLSLKTEEELNPIKLYKNSKDRCGSVLT